MSETFFPTHVKALLFDVFGTVVDWRGSIKREMQRFGEYHSIDKDWEQFALDWRALYQPAMKRIREGDRGYVKLDVLHRENLQELLSDYGLENCSESQLQYINTAWHRLEPWADTLPGMYRLKRNFILGSLSNGNVALMVNMARHSSIPWDVVLGSEPTRGYKPQAHVYLDSVEMLGLEPYQCLMVAAHNDDLQAARALGLRTAYVNRPYEYAHAQTANMQAGEEWDIICKSMTELADELKC